MGTRKSKGGSVKPSNTQRDEVICLRFGEWQVFWQGHLLPPCFNSKGAALAFLDGLRKGRKPI